MTQFSLFAAVVATALLVGCASVVAPGSQVPAKVSVIAASADTGLSTGTPARAWWRALKDPQLDALVSEAMQRNHDVRVAVATVKAARSMAEAAARDALPQGRLQAQAQIQQPSTAEADPYRQGLPRPPSSRVATLGQGLAWELDLFGRVGTAAVIAERRLDGATADLHAANALLQAEVVRHYAGLRLQQHSVRLLTEEANAQAVRLRQLRLRADAGLADRREALAAEGEQQRVLVEAAQSEAVLQAHLAALAVLCNRRPSEREAWHLALLTPAALPAVPAHATLVQPTDLLARRPDVARADAQLRAALGETALAERAHLPRLSLDLTLGLNAPFGGLDASGAVRHVAGPVLSWDWLDFGRIKARAAAAHASQDAAVHAFEQVVLKALQDSELAVRQWAAARTVLAAAQRAENVAAQSATYTRTRVDAGLEPPTAALDGSVTHLRAQRSALTAQADALSAFGQAQLALGAWQPQSQALAQARPVLPGAER